MNSRIKRSDVYAYFSLPVNVVEDANRTPQLTAGGLDSRTTSYRSSTATLSFGNAYRGGSLAIRRQFSIPEGRKVVGLTAQ
jgi:hypothetical protein